MLHFAMDSTALLPLSDLRLTHPRTCRSCPPPFFGPQQPTDATAMPTRKEVVFIDTAVADWQTLANGVRAGVEVVLIDASQSGLTQMAEWAKTHRGYDAIHVLSHGSLGTVNLGRDTLNQSSLASAGVQAELAQLGQALTADGDLLVYGCSVGSGEAGRAFLTNLSAATSADVAASVDLTGSAVLGGDWVLESKVGKVESSPIDAPDYSQLLAVNQVVNAGGTVWVRPNGTSYVWTVATGQSANVSFPGSYAVNSIRYYEVPGFGWLFNRGGHFETSTDGGNSWSTYTLDQLITTSGRLFRYVDASSSTTTIDNFGTAYTFTGNNPYSGETTTGGASISPDLAPTDITSNRTYFLSDATLGTTLVTLTPADTGLTTGGYWAIDSQSVPNLFTISFNQSVGNTATLLLGSGTVPAIGQTATVTARYYDLYQTDSSGNPINGQGYFKQFTYTVVDAQSNDLNFGNDLNVSTTAANDQLSPAVTTLSNGNFVAVWQSAGQGGESASFNGIYGQIYDVTGTAVGSEFAITTAGNSVDEITPVVSALNNGRFVVAYTSTPGANGQDIAYRIIEANGTVGSQLIANTSVTSNQKNPSI